MDRIELASFEDMLGIHPPWYINAVEINSNQKEFNVFIAIKDKKKIFGLIDHKQKTSSTEIRELGAWLYMPVGDFSCIIHAEVPPLSGTDGININLLNMPSFVGHPKRKYSNHLRQRVALADIKGLPENLICEAYRLKPEIYRQIKQDLSLSNAQIQALAILPTENDPTWRNILNDQLHIKTGALPLKLMLSKMKLATSKAQNDTETQAFIRDLRQFFMANGQSLDDEINQICGITNEKLKRQVSATKQRQRLVLPALKNPVWIDMLTGKLNLNSQSVPLNLLISRQRVAFLQGKDSASRIAAIENLREYVKQNHRYLRPELILINRAISINEKTQIRLPNPDHDIWQNILSDDHYVPSEHMAFKLLLARLRMQVHSTKDPVVRLEAARSIRNFMQKNHKSMQQELSAIAKQSQAV